MSKSILNSITNNGRRPIPYQIYLRFHNDDAYSCCLCLVFLIANRYSVGLVQGYVESVDGFIRAPFVASCRSYVSRIVNHEEVLLGKSSWRFSPSLYRLPFRQRKYVLDKVYEFLEPKPIVAKPVEDICPQTGLSLAISNLVGHKIGLSSWVRIPELKRIYQADTIWYEFNWDVRFASQVDYVRVSGDDLQLITKSGRYSCTYDRIRPAVKDFSGTVIQPASIQHRDDISIAVFDIPAEGADFSTASWPRGSVGPGLSVRDYGFAVTDSRTMHDLLPLRHGIAFVDSSFKLLEYELGSSDDPFSSPFGTEHYLSSYNWLQDSFKTAYLYIPRRETSVFVYIVSRVIADLTIYLFNYESCVSRTIVVPVNTSGMQTYENAPHPIFTLDLSDVGEKELIFVDKSMYGFYVV